MDKLKRVIIKEEYIAITGDTLEAVILNQMIYWSERMKDFDKFIKEENERSQKYYTGNPENAPKEKELTHGWIYKKAAEIKEEVMSTDSEKTVNRKMVSLVEKGFLDRRNNPSIKYDRTYQYRVNFPNIIKALVEKGYTLQDYKVDLNFIAEALKTLNGQNDDSKQTQDEESKRQIDALKSQIDALKVQNDVLKNQIDVLKVHGDGAIPETTTETTTEIISESTTERDSFSPSAPIDKFLNSIKSEMTEVSYKTWIEPLKIKEDKDKIIVIAHDSTIKDIIESRYLDTIQRHLKQCYDFNKIEVVAI